MERNCCKYTDIERRIILKTGRESVDRTDLAQDRNRWLVIVKIIMKLQVPQNAGNLMTT
jgi:hypothetical protein